MGQTSSPKMVRSIRKREASPSNVLSKNLPANLDAEKSVLSAILLNDENLSLASDVLVPDDFYGRSHKLIYGAIVELAQSNKKA